MNESGCDNERIGRACVYERKCKRSACVCECLNNGACVGLFVVRKGMCGGSFSMMGYVSVHVCMCEWACVQLCICVSLWAWVGERERERERKGKEEGVQHFK